MSSNGTDFDLDFDLEESSEDESNSFDDFDEFGDASSDDGDVSEEDNGSDSDSDEFDNFEVDNKEKDGKSLAIKIAVAGVACLFVVLILARIFLGSKSDDCNTVTDNSNTSKEWTQSDTTSEEKSEPIKNESATEILNNSESSSYSNSDYDSSYVEITGEDDIELNTDLSDLTFTITDIKHYAKSDANTLRVKTVLKGAISGYTGTYELEVPYSKGIKLAIGDSFNVKCRLGSYNGKNVIEEISY